ncbi:MAG: type II toxin-antitoxin system PemK/MazF family toxin [Patescibacteria group bacterium]
MDVIKKFVQWISLKERLHYSESASQLFNESEIWWCSIGENIGGEISGKSKYFSRPVFIFKKLSKNLFLGMPASTQKQKVEGWYVPVMVKGVQTSVILSQTRVFDSKRLTTRMGKIGEIDCKKIKKAFGKLFLS